MGLVGGEFFFNKEKNQNLKKNVFFFGRVGGGKGSEG